MHGEGMGGAGTVVCLGEAMGELSLSGGDTVRLAVGGDTLNTAVYLARQGLPVAYATAVGSDPFGTRIRDVMSENDISDTLLLCHETRTTGLYSITNTPDGERYFHYWRAQSAARDLLADPTADWRTQFIDARVIYLSGISLWVLHGHLERLFDLLSEAKSRGASVVFDGNYRPSLWRGIEDEARTAFARVMSMSDVVLPTYEDEVLLWQDESPQAALARISALGAGVIVLKQGPEGCLVQEGQACRHVPIPAPVDVVDTTAAGDSFNAGFLGAWLKGADLGDAALAGHALAGRVIGYRGALLPRDLPQ